MLLDYADLFSNKPFSDIVCKVFGLKIATENKIINNILQVENI